MIITSLLDQFQGKATKVDRIAAGESLLVISATSMDLFLHFDRILEVFTDIVKYEQSNRIIEISIGILANLVLSEKFITYCKGKQKVISSVILQVISILDCNCDNVYVLLECFRVLINLTSKGCYTLYLFQSIKQVNRIIQFISESSLHADLLTALWRFTFSLCSTLLQCDSDPLKNDNNELIILISHLDFPLILNAIREHLSNNQIIGLLHEGKYEDVTGLDWVTRVIEVIGVYMTNEILSSKNYLGCTYDASGLTNGQAMADGRKSQKVCKTLLNRTDIITLQACLCKLFVDKQWGNMLYREEFFSIGVATEALLSVQETELGTFFNSCNHGSLTHFITEIVSTQDSNQTARTLVDTDDVHDYRSALQALLARHGPSLLSKLFATAEEALLMRDIDLTHSFMRIVLAFLRTTGTFVNIRVGVTPKVLPNKDVSSVSFQKQTLSVSQSDSLGLPPKLAERAIPVGAGPIDARASVDPVGEDTCTKKISRGSGIDIREVLSLPSLRCLLELIVDDSLKVWWCRILQSSKDVSAIRECLRILATSAASAVSVESDEGALAAGILGSKAPSPFDLNCDLNLGSTCEDGSHRNDATLTSVLDLLYRALYVVLDI